MSGRPSDTKPANRREREREEMKRLITEAAAKLFATEGFERTTIRRIAEAIEYTPGAIYSYFKDKDEILYALHQQGFLDLQRHVFAAVTPGRDPVSQLGELSRAYLAFARAQPEMYHLMFVAQATSRTLHEVEEWPEGKVAYDMLRTLAQHAVEGGWIRAADPDVIAFALWSAAHGGVALEICQRCMVVPANLRSTIALAAFDYLLASIVLPQRAPRPAAPPPAKARR
jgi:AcrR family transcriptional regulator